MWWETLFAVLGGLVLLYVMLLILLWSYVHKHPETLSMKDALRLLPDLLRLIKRLAGDSSVPAGVRIRLVLLLVYLASPIDLVPDFLPVIGYADDVVIVALVLRSVFRHAGVSPLEQHWPGTPQGLNLIKKLAGITAAR